MRRGSTFHKSLTRVRLYAGVPLEAFLSVGLIGAFMFVAHFYHGLPACLVLWLLARWLTNKDPAWVSILQSYLKEKHIYDSIPRPFVANKRPRGWGKGLPW